MKKKSRRTQPASTIRKTTFKERNHGLTPAEKVIAEAPIEAIVNEYNLIQQKKSKLSKHLRDVVELKVQFLIKEGKIKNQPSNVKE
jgi:hypothetical protein